jgi:hypothetical protein
MQKTVGLLVVLRHNGVVQSTKASMTLQQLLGMALRLAAIRLILIGVQCVLLTQLTASQFRTEAGPLWQAAFLLPLFLAIGLWTFPMSVAHKLLPRDPHALAYAPASELLALGCCVLGLALAVSAIPTAYAYVLLRFAFADEMPLALPSGTWRVHYLSGLVQFFCGGAMLCMPRFIARCILPLANTDPSPSSQAS